MSKVNFSHDQLVEAVKMSTVTMTVCVPSQNYDARSGDWHEEQITYMDPQRFLHELEKLNGEGGN